MNNDLISRSELKKAIEKYRNLNCVSTSTIIGVRNVMYLIDNAPTVNLEKTSFMKGYNYGCDDGKKFYERPKGEWIMQRHDLDGCFYTCSNCGRMIRVPLFIDDTEDNETLADYPFCHCGADMRGKEKEGDLSGR